MTRKCVTRLGQEKGADEHNKRLRAAPHHGRSESVGLTGDDAIATFARLVKCFQMFVAEHCPPRVDNTSKAVQQNPISVRVCTPDSAMDSTQDTLVGAESDPTLEKIARRAGELAPVASAMAAALRANGNPEDRSMLKNFDWSKVEHEFGKDKVEAIRKHAAAFNRIARKAKPDARRAAITVAKAEDANGRRYQIEVVSGALRRMTRASEAKGQDAARNLSRLPGALPRHA